MNLKNHSLRKSALLGFLGIAVLVSLTVGAAELLTEADFVGTWQGKLDAGQAQLRIVFEVSASEDEELAATLDSPDQGATGIPVAAVEVAGDSVRFEISVLSATYEGRISEDKQAIEGEWRQSGHNLPLNVERVEQK